MQWPKSVNFRDTTWYTHMKKTISSETMLGLSHQSMPQLLFIKFAFVNYFNHPKIGAKEITFKAMHFQNLNFIYDQPIRHLIDRRCNKSQVQGGEGGRWRRFTFFGKGKEALAVKGCLPTSTRCVSIFWKKHQIFWHSL